ncbi:3-oxoacyl-ACP synthase [Spongiimicrobium salis]|uniref:3-oxoacyl-ACP synthase n=1 Tax=Spongiimicrobium salis TaxID=1667022 RepID=UPI00374DA43E
MEKELLYAFCQDFVNARITRIQQTIADVATALTSETKSSAGDKHETGRAMLQLEREKAGQQLAEAEKMKSLLAKVPKERSAESIGLGSLVKCSEGFYFLAISAGEYTYGAERVYCISAQTPIGKLLLGKAIGDTIVFRGKEIRILDIQ